MRATFICTQKASVGAVKIRVWPIFLMGRARKSTIFSLKGRVMTRPTRRATSAAHDARAQLAEVLHERHPALGVGGRRGALEQGHAVAYQLATKWRRTPTPRPAWKPSRMAAVT